MVYTTWAQGFKEANAATTAALKLETTLPHTLPNLTQRIFPSYISAATQWSNLLSSGLVPSSSSLLADGPTIKAEAIKKWRMCLERADLVKKKVMAMGGTVGKPVERVPVVSMGNGSGGDEAVQRAEERRSRREEADQISILRRSSTLQARPSPSAPKSSIHQTLHLPLWHDADATFLSPLPAAQLDAMVIQPSLSADQRAAHATWENIYTASNPFVDFSPCLPRNGSDPALVKVEQGIGANCSVVAGLNTLVAHNARCGTTLGVRNFVPLAVKRRKGEEKQGEAVRYWRVKVFFNGAWRSLVIDSRLPTSSTTSQSLHATVTPLSPSATNTASLLWLPLLEKAYMSLIGSYAFPGSTPATDIHALTGWTPERLVLSGAGFRRERTWARIVEGWERGTVLVTLGTGAGVGRNTVSDARVVPLHAYAVVDLHRDTDAPTENGAVKGRMVRVLNPWKRGRTRMDDGRAWTRDMLESLVEEAEDEEAEEPPDLWWMTWDEVCDTFDTVNLNWDTRIFENSKTVHAVYSGTGVNEPISVAVAAPSSGSDIWVLLQRHATTFPTSNDSLPSSTELKAHDDRIKMALEAVENSWEGSSASEVLHDDGSALEYTTSSWILRQNKCLTDKATLRIRPRFDLPVGEPQADDIAYTIAIYSDANLDIGRTSVVYPYENTINVDLVGRTAGGNSSLPTYMYNPQYRIEIKKDPSKTVASTSASIKCTLDGDIKTSYNLKLLWNRGKRVTVVETQDILADSGEYRYGRTTIAKSDLAVGVYTLIPSSFVSGKASQASVKLESTVPLDVSVVPQEGAGMFSRLVKGQWSGVTAAGRPSLGSYDLNPRYELVLPEPSSVFCRLQLSSPTSHAIPFSIAIFKRGPSGTLRDQVSTSGPYADTPSGVVTPQTYLEPGIYVVVPSTYAARVEGSFTISVYATRRIDLSTI